MSYRFKGNKVIIEGTENVLIPQSLPGSPSNGHIAIDSLDNKLKVYSEDKSRWIILGDAEDIVFDNSSNGFTSTEVQDAIEEARNSAIGGIFSAQFQNNGTSSNTWLNFGADPAPSNNTFFVVPFKSRLVGVSFTNVNDGVDLDIRVNIANYNSGSTINRTLIYQVRDDRTFVDTDFTSTSTNLNLEVGDKIGVYIADQGTNPNDPVVTLYFKIREEQDITRAEDFSSSFSITLGPITIILG